VLKHWLGVQVATAIDCFGRRSLQGRKQAGEGKGRSKVEENSRAES
jgi:hypothetical protein